MVYDNPKYYEQSKGNAIWPADNGFLEGTKETTVVKKGTMFKRIGEEKGHFLGNVEDSIDKRALAPHTEDFKEHYYILRKDYEMTTGKVAPWFDKPGGGEQFVVFKEDGNLYTMEELIAKRILKRKFKLFISIYNKIKGR